MRGKTPGSKGARARKSAKGSAKSSRSKGAKKQASKRSKPKGAKRAKPASKSSKKKGVVRKTARRIVAKAARKSAKAPARTKRARSGSRLDPRAHRLATDVRPTAMEIQLEVDPARSDRYQGEVRFNLQLERKRSSIELHACEMRISRATAHVADSRRQGRIVPHPERETVEIQFAEPLAAGHIRLELAFSARLRNDLCGLYSVTSGDQRFAFSQLAATSARRFVPCFDEPSMKARYRVALTTAQENVALSNAPIESEEIHDDGRKTLHFAATPLLSSYLLALAVGQLECSEPVRCGKTELRVWFVPGQKGMSDFALEVAKQTLPRLEDYFDLPYPYQKLDLVAVPDFEFGAMENAGAVFFRETLLLLDPAVATLSEQRRAAEVICHELAHMWFGNLVTMAWWDDLWLNEAFATWMAFSILDAWRPEWHVWQTFLQRRSAAMDADELANTHPIYAPVKSAAEAAENFDLITYEKGAAVIRMVERHLGADTFRDGVRLYLRRHRESNAVASDLWNALAETSGQQVERIVRPWLEQEGHPVVSIRRAEREGLGVVELQQKRMLQGSGPPVKTRWPLPMLARIGTGMPGETRLVRHLLRKARERIPAQGADLTFMYGNADECGFYRPLHAPDVTSDLIEDLGALTPIERQGFVDHQWALVRSGDVPLASLMELAAVVGADRDPEVLGAVQQPLLSLSKRLAPDAVPHCEARLRAWVEVYFGAQVDELGWDPDSGESDDTRLRRARIMSIVGSIGEASSVRAEATERCARYLEDRGSLDPNLADTVVAMAASQGDAALFEALLGAMQTAHTPQEKLRFLLALGDFRGRSEIERGLELCLGDEVPVQDVVFLLIRLFANRHAVQPTWAFVKKRWRRLEKQLPPQLGSRLIGATPSLLTPAYRDEVADFFRAHPLPAADRALRQALERFDWYQGFRERTAPQLEAYLAG